MGEVSFPEVLIWRRQDSREIMVEGVQVLIGGSFLTAPISQKGAEAKTGETALIDEAALIDEERLISRHADKGPGIPYLLNAILADALKKHLIMEALKA